MSELDPIRAPQQRRWFFLLVFAVVVFLLMLVSSSWWLPGPIWKVAVAGAISAGAGTLIGRWITPRAGFGKR